MQESHVYVAVRRDLPLACQSVQAVHAGISAGRDLIAKDCTNPNLVLLTVPDLPALLSLRHQCDAAGIGNRVFVEDDIGYQPTAIATEPVNGKARKIFQKLPLFTGA
jgi:hypothetical protein